MGNERNNLEKNLAVKEAELQTIKSQKVEKQCICKDLFRFVPAYITVLVTV